MAAIDYLNDRGLVLILECVKTERFVIASEEFREFKPMFKPNPPHQNFRHNSSSFWLNKAILGC